MGIFLPEILSHFNSLPLLTYLIGFSWH